MNNILRNYREKQIKVFESEKDKAIIAIKCEDETYRTMREARKSMSNGKEVISLGGYTFPKEVNEWIAKVRKELNDKIAKLDAFLEEVSAMCALSDNMAQLEDVLKAYGILTTDNRIA